MHFSCLAIEKAIALTTHIYFMQGYSENANTIISRATQS